MITRFICPHCHQSIDPHTLEVADGANAQYRICPACDAPVVLSATIPEWADASSADVTPQGMTR